MNTSKISLADFEPDTAWWVSHGSPMGIDLVINGMVDDDPFNEPYEVEGDWSGFPGDPSELMGTVTDGEWAWDGEGDLSDWKQNTITALKAFRRNA